MNKYNTLWEYVQKTGRESFVLTFDEIKNIAGIPIDHGEANNMQIIRIMTGQMLSFSIVTICYR